MDAYVECIEIPDGTAQEMALFYTDRLNSANAENRTGISKRYNEPMEVGLHSDWTREFKGTHFMFLEWRTARYPTKEEFFGEAND